MKRNDFLSTGFGVFLAAVFCNLLWGSASPCIKLGYRLFAVAPEDSMSQILFAGLRFSLAGLMTILLGSFMEKRPMLPKRSSARMVLGLALLQTVLQYTFFYLGLAHAPGFKGSIISSSGAFFAVLLAALAFRQENLTVRKLLGCVLGLGGIVLINLKSAGGDAGFRLNGEGFLLVAAFCYGLATVLIKKFSLREDPVALSGWQFLLGGCIMIAVGLLFGGKLQTEQPGAWLLLLYLGFVSAAAYALWSLMLQRHPVSKVAIYSFMNPVFGVFLSALMLGELRDLDLPRCLLALALVCLGILAVNLPAREQLPARDA